LPISYFVGLTLSIAKLSSENELIAITSFGLNPIKIVQIYLPFTILVVILLLLISLGLYPKAYQEKAQFLNAKKQEAKFNIRPSEYGQKFGPWLIYVDKKKDEIYKDITLLKIEKDQDIFITANKATMHNLQTYLRMNLFDGRSFSIGDSVKQIDFKQMILDDKTTSIKILQTLNDIVLYWSDIGHNDSKRKEFIFKVLISFFPLFSLFFILVLGYFNPRYNSNHSASISSVLVILYVVLANVTNIHIEYILPILWIVTSYIFYYFTTKKLY
jgi:lipopolysaccharide export system permease protein